MTSEPGDLHGKRVLVLGGETALGRALAVRLAAEAGAEVAITSLSPDADAEFAVNSALNELWAMGRQGLALVIDASDAAQVRAAVVRAERELGRLDLAVVATDEDAGLALDALRAALPERPVVALAPEREAAEAILEVRSRLYN